MIVGNPIVGISSKHNGGIDMQEFAKEYDTKVDSKKRITLRFAPFDYYHVSYMEDGRIILDPRELVAPFQISANTLSMIETSAKNLRSGKTSAPIDLSEFEE